MGFPYSPSLTTSIPASICRCTTSATALASLGSSVAGGACSRYIPIKSAGRERLPTWVVRTRFMLRFILEEVRHQVREQAVADAVGYVDLAIFWIERQTGRM